MKSLRTFQKSVGDFSAYESTYKNIITQLDGNITKIDDLTFPKSDVKKGAWSGTLVDNVEKANTALENTTLDSGFSEADITAAKTRVRNAKQAVVDSIRSYQEARSSVVIGNLTSDSRAETEIHGSLHNYFFDANGKWKGWNTFKAGVVMALVLAVIIMAPILSSKNKLVDATDPNSKFQTALTNFDTKYQALINSKSDHSEQGLEASVLPAQ